MFAALEALGFRRGSEYIGGWRTHRLTHRRLLRHRRRRRYRGTGGGQALAHRRSLGGVRHMLAVGSGKGRSAGTLAMCSRSCFAPAEWRPRRGPQRPSQAHGRARAARCFPAGMASSCRAHGSGIGWFRWGSSSPSRRRSISTASRRRYLRMARDARVRVARRPARRGRLGGADYLRRPASRSRAHHQLRRVPRRRDNDLLVTIPSTCRAAWCRARSRLLGPNRVVGYIENMRVHCRDCGSIRPLFAESNAIDLDSCIGTVVRPISPPPAIAASRCTPTAARLGGPSPTGEAIRQTLGS